MSKVDEVAARLQRDVEREDPYGCAVVNRDDLRVILDAYAALRDERDALRTRLTEAERRCSELAARLEAAEKVVETVFDMDPFDDTTQLNVLGMADNYVRQFKVGEKP